MLEMIHLATPQVTDIAEKQEIVSVRNSIIEYPTNILSQNSEDVCHPFQKEYSDYISINENGEYYVPIDDDNYHCVISFSYADSEPKNNIIFPPLFYAKFEAIGDYKGNIKGVKVSVDNPENTVFSADYHFFKELINQFTSTPMRTEQFDKLYEKSGTVTHDYITVESRVSDESTVFYLY
jgi:hypothetical protein